MDRLPETIKLTEWKPEKRLPEYIGKLPKIIKDIVIAIERSYSEITGRLNRMLKITVDKDGNVGIGAKPDSRLVTVEKGTLSNDPDTNKALAGLRVINSDDSMFIAFDANQIEQVGDILYLNYGSDANVSIVNGGGSVVIGGQTTTTSAKLDVAGTDGALMPPRLTTTQRDALSASNGMMIYNTTTNRFEGYENGAWVDL